MTEEILIRCVDYLICILEISLFYSLGKIHFKQRAWGNSLKKGVLITLIGTLIYLLGYVSQGMIKIILAMIIDVIFFVICFKEKIFKIIIADILYMILLTGIEYISMLLGMYMLGEECVNSLEYNWTWLELAIFSKLITFIVVVMINQRKDKRLKDIPYKIWFLTGGFRRSFNKYINTC